MSSRTFVLDLTKPFMRQSWFNAVSATEAIFTATHEARRLATDRIRTHSGETPAE